MRFFVAAFLACSFTLPSLGAANIEADASLCFVGAGAVRGVVPYVVTVKNRGSSVTGAAVVDSGLGNSNHRYVYPLDLPAGTAKRFIIYPRIDVNGEEATLHFEGGIRAHDISLTAGLRYGEERLVGLIGDRIGAISVVKSVRLLATHAMGESGLSGPRRPGYRPPNMPATPLADCYARPEDAPERAIGYQSLSALILSDGAERMSSAQWAAVRHWVLGGGSLIVLGGPSAAYVRCPDAQAVMPVRDAHGATAQGISLPASDVANLPAGPYAITTGIPVAGARVQADSHVGRLIVTRPYGSGTVLFVAFSPLESPLKGSQDSVGVWRSILSDASIPERGQTLWTSAGWNEQDQAGSMSGPGDASVNPFRIQLPPVEVVIGILVLYFVLVVPVTYVLLKRKQRLEWAWVTSPALSIAFAFVFYLFTASLYQAGLSRRTTGTLVAAAGSTDAEFIGASELFFPRGGTYDLTVPNAEALEASLTTDMDYASTPNTHQDMETVDNGSVTARDFGVGNLSFRRIYHCQPEPLRGTITSRLAIADGALSGTITNGSNLDLHNATVYVPELRISASVDLLPPGQTVHVSGSHRSDVGQRLPGSAPIPDGRREASCPYLSAFVSADQLGIPLGKNVGAPNSVNVLVSVPVVGGTK